MEVTSVPLTPTLDRVVLELLDKEDQTPGGVYIPDNAQSRQTRARVLAVGPGRYQDGWLEPIPVAVGDEVLIGRYSGNEVRIDAREYTIVRAEEILAVLRR